MAQYSFNAQAFGLFVHTRRFVAKEEMAEFARRMGVSRDVIYRIERARGCSVANFLSLCHALGEDPRHFLMDGGGNVVAWARVPRETVGANALQKRASPKARP